MTSLLKIPKEIVQASKGLYFLFYNIERRYQSIEKITLVEMFYREIKKVSSFRIMVVQHYRSNILHL